MVHGDTVHDRVDSLRVHAAVAYQSFGIGVESRPEGGLRRANWSRMSTGRRAESYPELMQKGSVCKNMIKVLLYIVTDIVGVDVPEIHAEYREMLEYRKLLLKGMLEVHTVTDEAGQWLNPEQTRRFVKAVDNVLAATLYLSQFYRNSTMYLYQWTVKIHYLNHLKQYVLQNRFNPKFYWVVRDEDHIGRIAQVIKSGLRAGGSVRGSYSTAEKLADGYVLRAVQMTLGLERRRWGVM